MKITELFNLDIALSSVPASSAGFSVPLLLVDATEVPIDKRYRQVTRSDYATVLSGEAKDWATTLWSQGRSIAQAYIGRWISTASSPYFVCTDFNTTIADWTSVTDGEIRVTDGTNNDDLSSLNFSGCLTEDDIAGVFETALQALVGPNITGLDTATCEIDALGRLVVTNSTTGSTAATISLIAVPAGSGTDLSGASYLNVASRAFAVAGVDAEGLDDAMQAVLALDDTPFVMHEIGGSIDQQEDLVSACAAYKKFALLNVRDVNAKDSGATTDIAYKLNAASSNNAFLVYTEHTDQYPSAAINGQIFTLPEGKGHCALAPISGCYESGLDADGVAVKALTVGERTALTNKGCDFLVKPVNSVHTVKGLTPGAVQVNHRVGFYWAEARSAESLYAYFVTNDIVTYSDVHIQACAACISQWLDILVERECVESYTMNVPVAADISAIEKATHVLNMQEVANIIAAYAINSVMATAKATV